MAPREKPTYHTLVDPVVLLLQPGDGEGALVLLVPLLGQVEAIRSSPSDRRCWTSRRTARERHFLADALHVLVLRSQLDRGRVPNVHLWDRSNLVTLLRKYQQDVEEASTIAEELSTRCGATCITPDVPLVPCVL